MNVNDKVRVELTEKGLEVYRQHHQKFCDAVPLNTLPWFSEQAKRTEPVLEVQLWDLMHLFGSEMHAGAEILFKCNEIEVIHEESE